MGVRTRAARRGYGLSLEGAGAGVLYLTTYAAFRLYGVLPATAAITLLVAVSTLTVWLAWRHDSQALAALAIAGGFFAPMLIVAGGEPLPLFSYFAVLNGAIFALAWAKAWRALNTLGFVFTFAGALAWAHAYYEPAHFAVVEPFLVLFFAFYVTIAILYARRGPLEAKSPVDGLLVFGVPLATFVLQDALVEDLRYGAAGSAVALAAVYGVLYAVLRNRSAPGFALLARAFLALAVIFATIAIPFAVDDRETPALWALEAAGAYWIGIRQGQRAVRAFALLVEFAAAVAFVGAGVGGADDMLFANAFFAGAILIAASALVTAFLADRAAGALPPRERGVVPLVFAWGVLWWLAAGGVELVRQLPDGDETHPVLAWVTASVALALVLSRLASWPRLGTAGVALLPTMVAVAVGDFDLERTTLELYGWLVWPFAWIVHWQVLRFADHDDSAFGTAAQRATWLSRVHAFSALALIVQLAWEASEWTGRVTPVYTSWIACAAALPPLAYLGLCTIVRHATRWPLVPYDRAYTMVAAIPIATLLAVWFFLVNVLSPGDPSPLPYWPIASPLDVTLALALWALIAWTSAFDVLPAAARARWVGAGVFVALNGLVLRTAHHWADIPWKISSLLASKPLQAALTLTWTVTALAIMVLATRRALRALWMTGAALLALVVVKLFLVDLAALAGLPRVISFLGVGALLLAIGFLSPLPPAIASSGAGEEAR